MKIGVVGLGNMATAMVGGIINAGLVKPSDITGSDYSKVQVDKAIDNLKIKAVGSNIEAVTDADYVILAVKPQVYEDVLKELSPVLKDNQVVISIAPGKTLGYLADRLGNERKVVRLMPNTPALVGEGCTGVCKNEHVTKEEFDTVMQLLSSFGKAYEVKENQMDAVVAVSGSSPAYVFKMIEAMADAAVAEGLDRATSYKMAAQAVLGSAKMVLETGKHPGELKDMVCSPGGTTIEAVRVLEEKGFRSAVFECMKACVKKSRGM